MGDPCVICLIDSAARATDFYSEDELEAYAEALESERLRCQNGGAK